MGCARLRPRIGACPGRLQIPESCAHGRKDTFTTRSTLPVWQGGAIGPDGTRSRENIALTASSELSPLRALCKGECVYLGLPRAQDKEAGRFGQLFLADLDAAIQEIQFTEGRLAHAPFTIILDEFSSYAIPEFTAVFEQARSAGIGVVVSVQTPSALADQQRGLGLEFRDAVVGDCGTILSFRLGPGDGARYLAEYVGKAERWFPTESATQSRGRTWHILNPSSWFGLTSRTDQRMRFSGARLMKDQVLEARALTQGL